MTAGHRFLPESVRPASFGWLLAASLILCFPVASLAAEPEKAGAEKPADSSQATSEEPTAPALPLEMPLSDRTAPGLRSYWSHFVESFDTGRISEALVELEALREARVDAGFRNLPSVSMTLVLMARELLERSPPETALAMQLLDAAKAVSPDVPELHGEVARVLYETNSGSTTEVFHGYFKEFLASLEYLPSSYGVILGGVTAFWLSGLLLMLCFTLALIIRYVKLFGHDLSHLVHLKLTKLQSTAFATFLVLFPLFVGWGIVPTAVVCWVALWLYMGRTERVLAVFLLLFVAAWPVLQRASVNIARGVEGPEAPVFRCFYEECSEADLTRLGEEANSPQPNSEAAYVAALVKYRTAWSDPDLLPARHNWLATMIASDEAPDPRLKLLLGNIAMQVAVNRCVKAKGDPAAGQEYFEEARTLYSDVMVAAPKYWEANFNMGRLLSALSIPSEAQQYIKKASERDSAGVRAKTQTSKAEGTGCIEGFSYNRELAVPEPDLRLLAHRTWAGRTDRLPIAHEVLLGTLPPATCYGLGLAGLFLWVLQLLLASVVQPSSRCVKCHGVRCVRCREELAILPICDECLHYKMKGQYVDPKEIWYRDQAIGARRLLVRRIEILSGVFVPGMGQFMLGRALRGLLFLGGIALVLGLVWLAPAVAEVASTPRIPAEHNMLGIIIGSVLASALYLWSLLDLMS